MRKRRAFLSLCLAVALFFSGIITVSGAGITPKESSNIYQHDYPGGTWAIPVYSNLVSRGDGTYTRVECINDSVVVENYNGSFGITSQRTIPCELPLFGGFYEGTNYFFFVFGQNNLEDDDRTEVVRIVRYTKSWTRVDHLSIYGANTYKPFRGGALRMVENGDVLYIHTCHEMYKHSDGRHHQANMTFAVRVSDMRLLDSMHQYGGGYSSHSFNQFVAMDGNTLITLDHGDAYPRSVVLFRYSNNASNVANISGYGVERVNVLNITGELGMNETGVCVGDLQVSNTHYLTVGSSVDQSKDNFYARKNIYITATPKNNFTDTATTFRWVTNLAADSDAWVTNPYLIKINENKFLLMWNESSTMHYRYVDGTGRSLTETMEMDAIVSGCRPVLIGTKLCWYATNGSAPVFYQLETVGNGKTGWVQESGKWYYVKPNHTLQTGWLKDGENWYYMNADGIMQTGWKLIGGVWYLFRPSGAMQTGWVQDRGIWYYLRDSGAMATGWHAIAGQLHQFDKDGGWLGQRKNAGWQQARGNWYYVKNGGALTTGWKQIGGIWYFFKPTGEMTTGWQKVGKTYYYMNADGAMQTGWKLLGGKWYYLSATGAMATGTVRIGNKTYRFDTSGACLNP